jgi:hypothetical protein
VSKENQEQQFAKNTLISTMSSLFSPVCQRRAPAMWVAWLVCSLSFLLFVSGCATMGPPPPPAPSIAEIIEASRAGKADEIIKRIVDSRAAYRLPASELARLRDQGVPDSVIDALQWSYIESIRREEAYRQFQMQHSFNSVWGCGHPLGSPSRFFCRGYSPWGPW